MVKRPSVETRMERRAQAAVGGYAEWPPPPELAGVAECTWSYRCPAGVTRPWHRVLPHTGVSLCFESVRDPSGWCRGGRLLILGPLVAVRVFEPPKSLHMEAIRLKVEWAERLLEIDPAEIRNEVLPWEARHLWPLRDRLLKSRSPVEALAALEREIGQRLAVAHPPSATVIVGAVLDRLRSPRVEGYRLYDVAKSSGVSERHLRRLVRRGIGMRPKTFQRIERLNRIVVAADRFHQPHWSDVAHSHGYCDQAHMVREVSQLCGTTPTALHRERRGELEADVVQLTAASQPARRAGLRTAG